MFLSLEAEGQVLPPVSSAKQPPSEGTDPGHERPCRCEFFFLGGGGISAGTVMSISVGRQARQRTHDDSLREMLGARQQFVLARLPLHEAP